MVLYKCIKEFPNGPELNDILQRGNHVYKYGSKELSEREVECSAEFFKEIPAVVYSFKNTVNGNIYTLNKNNIPALTYERGATTRIKFSTCISRYKIHSVLRINKGDVYKIGEHAIYDGIGQIPHKIDEFKIVDDRIFVHYVDESWYDDFIGTCSPIVLPEIKFSAKDLIEAFSNGLYVGKSGSISNKEALKTFKNQNNI